MYQIGVLIGGTIAILIVAFVVIGESREIRASNLPRI